MTESQYIDAMIKALSKGDYTEYNNLRTELNTLKVSQQKKVA